MSCCCRCDGARIGLLVAGLVLLFGAAGGYALATMPGYSGHGGVMRFLITLTLVCHESYLSLTMAMHMSIYSGSIHEYFD